MAHVEESRDPSDWFKKARKDRERVERCLRDEDFEDAAFHISFGRPWRNMSNVQ